MDFVDTHCHIHEIYGSDDVAEKWHKAGITDADKIIQEATQAGVTRMIIVGCSVEDSELATEFVQKHDGMWASIGMHPHEASRYVADPAALEHFASLVTKDKVVAIGECGLDYFYTHSPKEAQIEILHEQLELAQKHHLPMIFHVREAFDDFWPVFDQYKGIQGVIHSFSATTKELDQILRRDLYVGLNGIMTFTKNPAQLAAAQQIPINKLVLETDAPFLTPTPYRGTICSPRHVRVTGEFLASLRNEDLATLAQVTTMNACRLFGLS